MGLQEGSGSLGTLLLTLASTRSQKAHSNSQGWVQALRLQTLHAANKCLALVAFWNLKQWRLRMADPWRVAPLLFPGRSGSQLNISICIHFQLTTSCLCKSLASIRSSLNLEGGDTRMCPLHRVKAAALQTAWTPASHSPASRIDSLPWCPIQRSSNQLDIYMHREQSASQLRCFLAQDWVREVFSLQGLQIHTKKNTAHVARWHALQLPNVGYFGGAAVDTAEVGKS